VILVIVVTQLLPVLSSLSKEDKGYL